MSEDIGRCPLSQQWRSGRALQEEGTACAKVWRLGKPSTSCGTGGPGTAVASGLQSGGVLSRTDRAL